METQSSTKNILIFCQSPADIQYALALYEKYHKTQRVSISCINVEGMYLFLKNLNLDLDELIFIPYNHNIKLKNPFKIIFEQIRLKRLFQKYIKDKIGFKIYFFGIWYDWVTFYLLGKARNNNNIIYIKHYIGVNDICRSPKGLKEKITLSIFHFITNLNLKYVDYSDRSILFFPYYSYNIKQDSLDISDISIFDKYNYKLNITNPNTILLLESDLTSYNVIYNYKSTITAIVQNLKSNGYRIILKGHPRIGHSKELDKYIDEFVPNYIPAEFIDISMIKYIFGLNSTTLAFYAKKHEKVYSYIEDFDFISAESKKNYKNYLITNSDNKIKFISVLNNSFLNIT